MQKFAAKADGVTLARLNSYTSAQIDQEIPTVAVQ
jgi:hypothetical protein